MTSIVVNFFGGPCSGKSTMAAHLFAELKWRGIRTEYIPEVVKTMVFAERWIDLANQICVFGDQLREVAVRAGKVDVIVLDTSLLNSLTYHADKTSPAFKQLVLDEYHRFRNVNIFIERNHPYDTTGRYESEEEARVKDREVLTMLETNGIEFVRIKGGPENMPKVLAAVFDAWQNARLADGWAAAVDADILASLQAPPLRPEDAFPPFAQG
jgi:nicotinamide riboside kinase